MNKTAHALGLKYTSFANAHGLGNKFNFSASQII